jgi:uracil phosphoribosyltransferase
LDDKTWSIEVHWQTVIVLKKNEKQYRTVGYYFRITEADSDLKGRYAIVVEGLTADGKAAML